VTDGKVAVVTGACGGIGIESARRFGQAATLVLSDIAAERLPDLASRLREDGYRVAGTVCGDLRTPAVVDALCETIAAAGQLGLLVHTAGISAIDGGWRDIVGTNLLAAERLLVEIEPLLEAGSVAIAIASLAGHIAPRDAAIDALLDAPLAPAFLDLIEPHLQRLHEESGRPLSSLAYLFSKRGLIRRCQAKAEGYAAKGARIVSISPGVVATAMSRREMAAGGPVAFALSKTPLGRIGLAADVVNVAAFLASDQAGFVTGTDVRVDGGAAPTMLGVTF